MIRAYGNSDFSETENSTNETAIQQGMNRRSDPHNVEETASQLKQGRLKTPENLTPSPQLGSILAVGKIGAKTGQSGRKKANHSDRLGEA